MINDDTNAELAASLPPAPPAPAVEAAAPAPPAPLALDAPSTKTLKPVHVDGGLYTAIGALTALLVCLESDVATKLIPPLTLWIIRTFAETANGGLLALKMFRSTGYSDSIAGKG